MATRGQGEDRLRTQLREISKYKEELDEILDGDVALQKKIHGQLMSKKDTEPDFFGIDTRYANLLTYLNIKLGDPVKARIENTKVLDKEPNNLVALSLQGYIFLITKCLSDCKGIIIHATQLTNAEHYDFCQRQERSELCYCMYTVGPQHYLKARERWEILLKDILPNIDQDTKMLVKDQEVLWCFDLAQVNSRLLNRGILSWKELNALDVDKHFIQTKQLLLFVKRHSPLLAGRALVELADCFQKYETTPPMNKRKENLPETFRTVADCFLEAVRISPEDPFVLERAGRHFRTQAKSIDEFKYAISFMERALKISPERHVCLHHMALAFKAMAAIEGGLPEANLYSNPVKCGIAGKKKLKSSQSDPGCAGGGQDDLQEGAYQRSYSAPAEGSKKQKKRGRKGSKSRQTYKGLSGDTIKESSHGDNTRCESGIFSLDPSSPQNSLVSPMSKVSLADVDSGTSFQPAPDSGSQISRAADASEKSHQNSQLQSHVLSNSTIISQRPCVAGPIPKHYERKRPDKMDRLRVSNSAIPDDDENMKIARQYMEKALDYIKSADKIVNSTSSRFLIDMGRIHISLGNTGDAESCFLKADALENVSAGDGAYLYEQWGMLKRSLFSPDLENPDENFIGSGEWKDIKEMYYKALTWAISCGQRSRIAFNELRNMIQIERDRNPSNPELIKEYAFLFKEVRDYKKSYEIFQQVLLSSSANDRQLKFELSELLFQMGNIAGAYMYMAPQLEQNTDFHQWQDTHKELAIDILHAICHPDQQGKPRYIYPKIFHAMFSTEVPSKPSEVIYPKYHVTFMACSEDDDCTNFVQDAFESFCRLKVFLFYTGESSARSAITPGQSYLSEGEKGVDSSLVVINMDDLARSTGEEKDLFHAVQSMQKVISSHSRSTHMCLVTGQKEHKFETPFFLSTYPVVNTTEYQKQCNYNDFIADILRVALLNADPK